MENFFDSYALFLNEIDDFKISPETKLFNRGISNNVKEINDRLKYFDVITELIGFKFNKVNDPENLNDNKILY